MYQDIKDMPPVLGMFMILLVDRIINQLELNVLSVLFDVYTKQGASQVALMIKNPYTNAGGLD